MPAIDFDRNLINKCQINAPRYTSYPTADRFTLEYNKAEHLTRITTLSVNNTDDSQHSRDVSLYIHIPFCNTLCLYCACNKIITNKRDEITKYLAYLDREIALYASIIGTKLNVVQLHFGGGSPSWLLASEVAQIMHTLRQYFNLSNAHEIAMEIDPRHTTREFIHALANLGFNRISLGLQDFNPQVQKAVNRVQSFESCKTVLDAAKDYGFKSTNVDLIYGLPLQNLSSFTTTIEQVLELRPARIALFNYAHLPNIFVPQTRIKESDLPSAELKLDILQMSVAHLTAAGYVFIGMDHFALADDELTIALNNKTLQRNFQGYSTFADTDMLSFGVSSIGYIANSYYQNVKDLASYYLQLDSNILPLMRGKMLTDDDLIRKRIIMQIMCQYTLNYGQIAEYFKIDFLNYFAQEIGMLQSLADLGLIALTESGFNVTQTGRFLIRNVAMIFDKYLRQDMHQSDSTDKTSKMRYSKVI